MKQAEQITFEQGVRFMAQEAVVFDKIENIFGCRFAKCPLKALQGHFTSFNNLLRIIVAFQVVKIVVDDIFRIHKNLCVIIFNIEQQKSAIYSMIVENIHMT